MIRVEEKRGLDPEVRAYLRRDPVRNAFVLHDLSAEPERTRFWLARHDGEPAAHLLVYDSSEFGAVWAHLAGDPEAAQALAGHLPDQKVVVITPEPLSGLVVRRVADARVILEDIMGVGRGDERLPATHPAVRVGPEHAEAYARLVVPSVVPWTPALVERNRQHLADEVVYGVFADDRLVSVAGSSVRTEDAWIVGGVETLPEYRRRGFARAATAAVVREALSAVGTAGLWVNSANGPAIALYRALGFRKAGGSAWIDVGTGMEP